MSLNFTNPAGFRFFSLVVMITVILLGMSKSIVDQFDGIAPIVRFSMINVSGYVLFVASMIYGRKISDAKAQWYYNAFLSAGIVLLSYSSTVEIESALHSKFIPIFYIVELLLLLIIGGKSPLILTPTEKYFEMVRPRNFQTDTL